MADTNAPLSDRYPILIPALRETYHFSKAQLLMNALLGIIGILVSYHYGLLTNVQFWAAIKAFAVIYVGLLAATAILNFIRSPLRMLASHHHQLAAISSARVFPADAHAYPATPDLEYTNAEIVERWLYPETGFTGVKPEESDSESISVGLVLARFYYKPDRGVPPSIYVKAHLAIANSEGVPIKTRYDAVWEKEPESEYKEFETAKSYKLIIAALPGVAVNQIMAVEHDDEQADGTPLDGKEFRFQLTLIGKHLNEPVLNQSLKFSLSLDPKPELRLL